MSAEIWERRKNDHAIPLLQWVVAYYLTEGEHGNTVRRLIVGDDASEKDAEILFSIFRDALSLSSAGQIPASHPTTMLNLIRRRAGKAWLTAIPETEDLTLKALAMLLNDPKLKDGGSDPVGASRILMMALCGTLFEILNSTDGEFNEEDVNKLLVTLWAADSETALAVYSKTTYKVSANECVAELLRNGAKPVSVIGLMVSAMELGNNLSVRANKKRMRGTASVITAADDHADRDQDVTDTAQEGTGVDGSEVDGKRKKKKKRSGVSQSVGGDESTAA